MKLRDQQSNQGGINVKLKNRKAHCLTQHWLPGCVGPTFTMVRKHVCADHIQTASQVFTEILTLHNRHYTHQYSKT